MVIDLGILSIKVDVLIIQIINIVLLFWIIKKAFGDTIAEQIAHFRETKKQLAQADQSLKELALEAEQTKQEIIAEGHKTREQIISEAIQLGKHKEQDIINQAEQKANEIVNQASIKAQLMETELKDNYQTMIKQGAGMMLKKIFHSNKQAQENYLKAVMEDI